MADLRINRFTVRYQGKDYGPGSVIYNVPASTANKLVADSNGTIDMLPKRVDPVPVQGNNPVTGIDNEGTGTDNDGPGGLPPVDPKKTVKK